MSKNSCPVDALLSLVAGRWTSYILWVLTLKNGPLRFGELKREIIGVSSKSLTEKLKLLEQAQLISRTYVPSIPPAVSYALTARGIELKPFLESASDIAHRWRKNGTI